MSNNTNKNRSYTNEFKASVLKRLEKGKVVWPDIYDDEITMNLSLEDFYNLIKSPGIKQKIKRDEVWRNH